MEANTVPKKKPEYGLIILGNAGAGKSYICNMIIGHERFETACRREAVTTAVEFHRIDAGSSDLLIFNLPGLVEPYQEEIDRHKREITKAFKRCPISVVIFVWTQVDGRPQPDDVIAFKALQEAYKFPSQSLMFVLNNIPSKRPPTYDGRFFALLTKMLNPMSISLEDMFFLDTLNSEDNETFSATRDRLLCSIAQYHETEQKLHTDIIMQSDELRMLRKVLKEQYLQAEESKYVLEMVKQYEAVRKEKEKRYHVTMFKSELEKQQGTEGEHHELIADVESTTIHEEKKTGRTKQCQQLWKQVEDERGICKKVEKSYQIARNGLCRKHKSDEEKNVNTQNSTTEKAHERKVKFHGCQLNKVHNKITKFCNDNCDSTLIRPAVIGGVAGAGIGAAAGAVVGGAAGVILGPCAIATAAVGAAAGTAVGGVVGVVAGTALGAVARTPVGGVPGVTIGGISCAMATLYRFRKRPYYGSACKKK